MIQGGPNDKILASIFQIKVSLKLNGRLFRIRQFSFYKKSFCDTKGTWYEDDNWIGCQYKKQASPCMSKRRDPQNLSYFLNVHCQRDSISRQDLAASEREIPCLKQILFVSFIFHLQPHRAMLSFKGLGTSCTFLSFQLIYTQTLLVII